MSTKRPTPPTVPPQPQPAPRAPADDTAIHFVSWDAPLVPAKR